MNKLKCGCIAELFNNDFGDDEIRIVFCALHTAAEEMLKFIKQASYVYVSDDLIVETIIAKADGRGTP